MNRALSYRCEDSIRRSGASQLCNRNAGRGGYRVDWVGFEHCIRNSGLNRRSR